MMEIAARLDFDPTSPANKIVITEIKGKIPIENVFDKMLDLSEPIYDDSQNSEALKGLKMYVEGFSRIAKCFERNESSHTKLLNINYELRNMMGLQEAEFDNFSVARLKTMALPEILYVTWEKSKSFEPILLTKIKPEESVYQIYELDSYNQNYLFVKTVK